mmetsp:Transcript_16767/g.35422  ORF Transcript_16767/g.35422 Transcript_16767/m.35422 type:complete len:207 (+) Transcript_16767:6376-6996(+)
MPQSRTLWVVVFRPPLLFPSAATRPRPADEMGCQDGGHSGSGGCARNFRRGRHCFLSLRAGVAASSIPALKTLHAGALCSRSGRRHSTGEDLQDSSRQGRIAACQAFLASLFRVVVRGAGDHPRRLLHGCKKRIADEAHFPAKPPIVGDRRAGSARSRSGHRTVVQCRISRIRRTDASVAALHPCHRFGAQKHGAVASPYHGRSAH